MHVFVYMPIWWLYLGEHVLVSSNSRGWMEDRLSGSQGRVDPLLKTVEQGMAVWAHVNSQNQRTVLVVQCNCCRQEAIWMFSSWCSLYRFLSFLSLWHVHMFTIFLPLVPLEEDGSSWQKSRKSLEKLYCHGVCTFISVICLTTNSHAGHFQLVRLVTTTVTQTNSKKVILFQINLFFYSSGI